MSIYTLSEVEKDEKKQFVVLGKFVTWRKPDHENFFFYRTSKANKMIQGYNGNDEIIHEIQKYKTQGTESFTSAHSRQGQKKSA